MKLYSLSLFVIFALTLTSCYQSEEDITTNSGYVTFNLTASGIEQSSLTRAISEPGNLLIIDKFGDEITTETKTSLASFAMPLKYGTHDIYFVAADIIWSSYSTTDMTVTWPNSHAGLSYVWAYHLNLTVDDDTSIEEITLPLVVANVRLKTYDNVSTNVASMKIEAPNLCKGLNLNTMSGFVSEGINYTLNISSAVGKNLSINMYTFVPSTGYVGDIVFSALDSSSKEIKAKTLSSVPVQQGYISYYAGYFFSEGQNLTLSYTDDWLGTNEYEY